MRSGGSCATFDVSAVRNSLYIQDLQKRATIGLHVARAIAEGYVKRNPAPNDRRSYQLYLTPRGQAILSKLRERIPAHEKLIGARLTNEERKQLRALLDKMVYG